MDKLSSAWMYVAKAQGSIEPMSTHKSQNLREPNVVIKRNMK
jgi:hypothetical protein